MIVRDKPGIWQLLFSVRGSILPRITPPLLALMAIAAALVAVDHWLIPLPQSNATPFSVLGVALSLFLGFRNNAAYDRWWEARRLWGGLLADLRAFARELEMFLPDADLRARLIRLSLGFLHLHRTNLRGQTPDAAVRALVHDSILTAAHPPCAALDAMNATLAQALRDGQIDGFGARALSARLGTLALNQAGCERIANTPLPYVYSLLIFRTVYVYCLLLPLALIGPEGWLAPLFVGLVAYVFLGLAEVTEDLAHPFGASLNALPLDAMCRTAEISLAAHLGETPPAPLKPQDYYLS